MLLVRLLHAAEGLELLQGKVCNLVVFQENSFFWAAASPALYSVRSYHKFLK